MEAKEGIWLDIEWNDLSNDSFDRKQFSIADRGKSRPRAHARLPRFGIRNNHRLLYIYLPNSSRHYSHKVYYYYGRGTSLIDSDSRQTTVDISVPK